MKYWIYLIFVSDMHQKQAWSLIKSTDEEISKDTNSSQHSKEFLPI